MGRGNLFAWWRSPLSWPEVVTFCRRNGRAGRRYCMGIAFQRHLSKPPAAWYNRNIPSTGRHMRILSVHHGFSADHSSSTYEFFALQPLTAAQRAAVQALTGEAGRPTPSPRPPGPATATPSPPRRRSILRSPPAATAPARAVTSRQSQGRSSRWTSGKNSSSNGLAWVSFNWPSAAGSRSCTPDCTRCWRAPGNMGWWPA